MATLSKVREELAQTFLDALNQGQLPWRKCWSQALPVNAVTGKTYRGINTLMLSWYADRRGYTDTRWCTYNQAQDKGWQVRKGSKGVKVEYWACYDTKEKKLLSWDDVRQKVKADPDYEKYLQLRCRTYTVFNGEQIDGIPEPEQRPSTDIGTLREKRDTLIRNMGIGYQEGGIRAYYSPGMDMVTLPPEATFDDTYSYMATLLHECGHATGHPSRLNRDLTGGFGSESYAREELRAEIASAFTAQTLGLQLTDGQLQYQTEQHTAYIQAWAGILQDSPEELFRAIKEAEAISDYLIEKGEFNMEQLFKAETVQQRKIMEWLVDQGITGKDIADVQLTAPAMVRLTNPAGQYMDVYCSVDCAVRILDVSEEREAELQQLFWDETNDPETQEWREDLTADEAAIVEQWDAQTAEEQEAVLQELFWDETNSDQLSSEEAAALARQYPSFSAEQLKEITAGLQYGLTPAEISFYAKPEFNDEQMKALRYCVSRGDLQPEQLAVIANPAFDAGQMDIISRGFEEGMSMEQVKSFAQPGLTRKQMLHRYLDLQYGPWQPLEPAPAAELDMGPDQTAKGFSQMAYPASHSDQLSSEEAAALAENYPGFKVEQLQEISAGIHDGLTAEQIAYYARPEFGSVQMNALRYCVTSGLTLEQLAVISNPAFGAVQMDVIRSSFQSGMTMEQVATIARPELTPNQMLERYWDFRNAPTPEEVAEAERLEREFWKMDDHLKKGGDIAELADWYEKDLAPDWD